jgi:putative membrane protein
VTLEPTSKADAPSKLALDRTRLAYDRTMLAWVRTATSLISFGFSIQQFFRIAQPDGRQSGNLIRPHQFGLLMIAIGLLALLLAALEHRSSLQALRLDYPVTEQYQKIAPSRAAILAALIAILGLLALIDAIFHV